MDVNGHGHVAVKGVFCNLLDGLKKITITLVTAGCRQRPTTVSSTQDHFAEDTPIAGDASGLGRHVGRAAAHMADGSAKTIPLNLNSVNQLIFVMVKCGVLFEVRTEFLNNI
jgi:hypothetical protein